MKKIFLLRQKFIGDKIYFKAVKNHPRNEPLDGRYYLYYQSKNIKYLTLKNYSSTKSVYVMSSEEDIREFKKDSYEAHLYDAKYEDINFQNGKATKNSDAYYKISFFNDGLDWKDSLSQKPGAKATAKFSGPVLSLMGLMRSVYGYGSNKNHFHERNI
jgi:hypothetical protein